jgi:hypoxanthine phosphoribosyltransferase
LASSSSLARKRHRLNMFRISHVRAAAAAVPTAAALLFSATSTKRVLAEPSTSFETKVLGSLKNIEEMLQTPPPPARTEVRYADSKIEQRLFTEEQVAVAVKDLGERISRDYAGEELIVVGLLTGVFMFMGDLVREITIPHVIDFMVVSSYGQSSVSSANVKIKKDLGMAVNGKNVLIVDEICDSGFTMASLKALLEDRGAKVKTCVLLDKKARRNAPIDCDYIGLDCPDEFGTSESVDHLPFDNLIFCFLHLLSSKLQLLDMEWTMQTSDARYHMLVFSKNQST